MNIERIELGANGPRSIPMYAFMPRNVFRIPYHSVRLCQDNGEGIGPWICFFLLDAEIHVQFETGEPEGEEEGELFMETLWHILEKHDVPVEFSVDPIVADAYGIELPNAA